MVRLKIDLLHRNLNRNHIIKKSWMTILKIDLVRRNLNHFTFISSLCFFLGYVFVLL